MSAFRHNQTRIQSTLRDLLGGDPRANVVTIGYAGQTISPESPEAHACDTLVLGPGSILAGGSVVYPSTPSVVYGPKVHDFQVWPGDVLVRTRGVRGPVGPVAVHVTAQLLDAAGRKRGLRGAIFNSNLIRIRLRDGHDNAPGLDPQFLALAINAPAAQRFFASRMQRSSVSGISRKDLLDLPLTLPPLEEQVLFGRIHQLQVEHAHITGEINRRYADLIQSCLSN